MSAPPASTSNPIVAENNDSSNLYHSHAAIYGNLSILTGSSRVASSLVIRNNDPVENRVPSAQHMVAEEFTS